MVAAHVCARRARLWSPHTFGVPHGFAFGSSPCPTTQLYSSFSTRVLQSPPTSGILCAFLRGLHVIIFLFFSAPHAPTPDNCAVDALSRFQIAEFHRLLRNACPCLILISASFLSQLCPPNYSNPVLPSTIVWLGSRHSSCLFVRPTLLYPFLFVSWSSTSVS